MRISVGLSVRLPSIDGHLVLSGHARPIKIHSPSWMSLIVCFMRLVKSLISLATAAIIRNLTLSEERTKIYGR
jgi:hypothetical protein